MATANPYNYPDNSTLTNFKTWAQSISTFIGTTAGWVQSTDTGQVNWSTISSVPSANNYVYEIWQPNDSLTNFYLKMEYGSSNQGYAGVRTSIGTTTNGAGTLTGFTIGPFVSDTQSGSGSTTVVTQPCWLSGAPGRLCLFMWDAHNLGFVTSVERSINNSGTYTGTHVTLTQTTYYNVGNSSSANQQTILFGVGAVPAQSVTNSGGSYGGLSSRQLYPSDVGSIVRINPIWQGQWGFDLVYPYIGYWDNPLTNIGVVNNWVYGTYQTTVYGATRTYYITPNQPPSLYTAGTWNSNQISLMVRYD